MMRRAEKLTWYLFVIPFCLGIVSACSTFSSPPPPLLPSSQLRYNYNGLLKHNLPDIMWPSIRAGIKMKELI